MKRKMTTMVGIAAVVGAVSIFAADSWIKNSADARARAMAEANIEPAAPAVAFNTLVVAKEPLRFGMTIDAAKLVEIPWPQSSLPQGAFSKIDTLLAEGSRMVLTPIEPNEPVLLAKLSGPNGRATLSNLLTPGMRAVTIKTDEIAGVGGFVTPGDRVDIVLTRDSGSAQAGAQNTVGAAGSTLSTEVVYEGAKVLSVGQGADERQTMPQVANSVTVEVTTEGAQKIALARNVGTLSLTLRAATETASLERSITTIAAFGDKVVDGVSTGAEQVVQAIPAGPAQKTVIVTRALSSQEYTVVKDQPGQRPKQEQAAQPVKNQELVKNDVQTRTQDPVAPAL